MRSFELTGGLEVADASDEELARLQVDLPGDAAVSLDDWHLLSLRSVYCARFRLVVCGRPSDGHWTVVGPLNGIDGLTRVRTVRGGLLDLGVRRFGIERHLCERVRQALEEGGIR